MIELKADAESGVRLFTLCRQTGKPAVFPTDTIYGIGAPVDAVQANERIFELKARQPGSPLPVLIGNREQLDLLAAPRSDRQTRIIESAWPGSVTFILPARDGLPPYCTKNGTVAVRHTPLSWLAEAISVSGPVTATSANISASPYVDNVSHIVKLFVDGISGIITNGESGECPSWIVDLSGPIPEVIRNGSDLQLDISLLHDNL